MYLTNNTLMSQILTASVLHKALTAVAVAALRLTDEAAPCEAAYKIMQEVDADSAETYRALLSMDE
jgi:phosphoenolpyruvate carboxylase